MLLYSDTDQVLLNPILFHFPSWKENPLHPGKLGLGLCVVPFPSVASAAVPASALWVPSWARVIYLYLSS